MSDTEKQAVPPSSPPTVAGEDDSIRCLCGSKLDNKGLVRRLRLSLFSFLFLSLSLSLSLLKPLYRS